VLVDPSDQSRVVWSAGLGRISNIGAERLSLGTYPEFETGRTGPVFEGVRHLDHRRSD